jgi:hypothetical protein
MSDARLLQELLEKHADKRVCVIGPTCCGKSRLLESIPTAVDMDVLLFDGYCGAPPLLNPEEQAYVCRKPWTEEIGQTMTHLARERIRIEPGRPVFGTVALDCDLYVYLRISDRLLQERCAKRNVPFEGARMMREQTEAILYSARVPCVEFLLE